MRDGGEKRERERKWPKRCGYSVVFVGEFERGGGGFAVDALLISLVLCSHPQELEREIANQLGNDAL